MFAMKKFIYFIVLAFTLTACSSGSGVFNAGNTSVEMWVVIDGPSDYTELIALYNQQYPNIPVKVKKLRLEDYEEELVDALAEDRGPDIFMLHNTWMRKYLTKITPLPSEISLPQAITTGAIKKEVVIRQQISKSITPLDVSNKFVDVVYDDVVINNEIYGLPLFVDSLVLYYNRDLLNNAAIPQPPIFWDQFQSISTQLTKINAQNEIVQSGSSLGTAKNIDNAIDILTLLMMQNGAEMTSPTKTAVAFHKAAPDAPGSAPAAEALRFYTDFALPQTTAYSWNADQPNNLEAFTSGQLAFFLGYAYHLPLIKSQTLGKLNLGISPMLQIQNRPPVNSANYWIPTVSNKSNNINAAWSFIQFIASPSRVPTYLANVKKPTALRELIDAESSDPDLFAHTGQALSAKNWYYGIDPAVAKDSFDNMIQNALLIETGQDRLRKLLQVIKGGATAINQTYR
jgi:ABC-type glycerol-3-phosphate transport system substrate-binding protein